MKRLLRSEIGAVILWIAASLFMAATIAPWFYEAGKTLAAEAALREFPAWIESVASSCGRAKLDRYFDRSLLLSALCFLPFLFRRIKQIRRNHPDDSRFALQSIPPKSVGIHLLIGFLIAGGLLWALGMILVGSGAYHSSGTAVSLSRLISKAVAPMIGASLVEEWLFRGLLLGLWLRFSRPLTACIGSALLFSFLHFLKPPVVIADPGHVLAGFEMLGKTLLHFTNPLFFVTDFATLALVGMILAYARIQTGALWFSIGLHAGWILAFKTFGLLYLPVLDHPLIPWGVGYSLRSGALPLLALALTAWICHVPLKRLNREAR